MRSASAGAELTAGVAGAGAALLGSRTIARVPVKALVPYLNERMLYQFHWGYRKDGRPLDDFMAWAAKELRPVLSDLDVAIRAGHLHAAGRLRLLEGRGRGQRQSSSSARTARPSSRASALPRQSKDGGLCIADFLRDVDDGERDVIGLQVVTVGQRASEVAREWFADDRYQDYVRLHGLASRWPRRWPNMSTSASAPSWASPARTRATCASMLKQGYRGSRYSFGYPACPNLADQTQLLELAGRRRASASSSPRRTSSGPSRAPAPSSCTTPRRATSMYSAQLGLYSGAIGLSRSRCNRMRRLTGPAALPQKAAQRREAVPMATASVTPTALSEAEHGVQLRRAVIASTIGTTIEWYDFFLYSIVTGARLRQAVLSRTPIRWSARCEAFGIYAVGFVARPIGAAIFGHYGDRIGRKSTLIATLLLMGIATFSVGFVPTYESIGIWGAVILTVAALHPGHRRRRRVGRLGAAVDGMGARPTRIAASSPRGRSSACRPACSSPTSRCWRSARCRATQFLDLGLADAVPAQHRPGRGRALHPARHPRDAAVRAPRRGEAGSSGCRCSR